MQKLFTALLCLCYCYGMAQHAKIFNITSTDNDAIENITMPDMIESSFELVDRLIFVQAEIGKKTKDFIFDTGAPVLIINSSDIETDYNSNAVKAIGVSGAIDANSIFVDAFNWKGLQQEHFFTYAIDISHLERLTERRIGGLIGFNAFKDYELMIDYDNSKVKIYKEGVTDYHKGISPKDSISFFLYDHFPVIEVELDGKKYNFGIDSGAEFNLINYDLKTVLEHLLPDDVEEIELYGADKSVQNVLSANIARTDVAGDIYEHMEYVFTDISHLNDERHILDGLLGYPFLSSKLFSINVRKGLIYIWD